jgi:hypothetical protein
MNSVLFKVLIVWLIFLGEALSIYAEIIGAKSFSTTGARFFSPIFWRLLILIIGAGICLLVGYMLGFKVFQNIWIITVISLMGILIVEPTLDYMVFCQLPGHGALVGLICGVVGFISVLVF